MPCRVATIAAASIVGAGSIQVICVSQDRNNCVLRSIFESTGVHNKTRQPCHAASEALGIRHVPIGSIEPFPEPGSQTGHPLSRSGLESKTETVRAGIDAVPQASFGRVTKLEIAKHPSLPVP